jgi:ATP-dependent Lhr-like helicase
MREVLLGALPAGVTFTARATSALGALRATYEDAVSADRLLVHLPADTAGRWWTWAGTAANRTLQASLPSVVDPRQRIDEKSVRLLQGVTVAEFSEALSSVAWQDPAVDANALRGLKFSSALPADLAKRTLSARLADRPHAVEVSTQSLLLMR